MSYESTDFKSLIKRKWPPGKPLLLDKFQQNYPDYCSELNKTDIGKAIVLGQPPPILLTDQSEQPPYEPSVLAMRMEAQLTDNSSFAELSQLNQTHINERKEQTDAHAERFTQEAVNKFVITQQNCNALTREEKADIDETKRLDKIACDKRRENIGI